MNGYSSDSRVDIDRREYIISESKSSIYRNETRIQELKDMNIMLQKLLKMSDDFLLPYNLRPLLSIEEIKLICAQQICEEFNNIFTSSKSWECHHNIEQQIEHNLSTINTLLEEINTYKKDIDFYNN